MAEKRTNSQQVFWDTQRLNMHNIPYSEHMHKKDVLGIRDNENEILCVKD